MAEIKIKFDLTFSRRFITVVGAAAMMFCAVAELESESVTLSTYYPAPSGVYTNMITTGNTFLARDAAGNVGIGTTSPAAKLAVVGGADTWAANFYGLPTSNQVRIGTIGGVATIGAQDNAGLLWADLSLNPGGNVGIGTPTPGSRLEVNGKVTGTDSADFAGAILSRQGSGACNDVEHTYPPGLGGTWNLCPGPGDYVTAIDGFYATKYVLQILPSPASDTVTARCCPCPSGGCPL